MQRPISTVAAVADVMATFATATAPRVYRKGAAQFTDPRHGGVYNITKTT